MRKLGYVLVFLFSFFMFNIGANAATISDGVYTIKSAIDGKVLDVANGNAKSGNNVWLYNSNNTNAQKWYVENLGNDYYKITTALDNDKVLDVSGAGKSNGTNVQIYSPNNTNAQKWYLKYAGDGYYYIMSKCNNLYVDVSGGKSANGTNIQMYKGNGTKAQKFKFIEVLEGKQTIEDGTYTISSLLDQNKVLDVANGSTNNSTNVWLYSANNTWAQMWDVKYLNNGYYSITTYLDNTKSLDVSGGGRANETNIQIYSNNNSDAQRWIIKDAGDGYFNIVSKLDNMYVDVSGGNTNNKTNIQLYHGNDTKAQKFKFNKVDLPQLADGLYTISTSLDETKLVSVDGLSANNSVNINISADNNLNSQKWYVKKLTDGYYSITSALSNNYVMDVANGSKTSGANVWLYSSNNTDAQKWYLKYAEDGYYYIVTKNSNLYLDVANGSTLNKTNIWVYNGNKSKAQKFKFTQTTLSENKVEPEDGYYTISSSLNDSKVLDVKSGNKTNGTNIQLYDNNNSNAQIWYLKNLNNGYYSITSAMNPETALTASSASAANGVNVELAKYYGASTQMWYFKDAGNGFISLISKANDLYLNVNNSGTANGTNIELWQKQQNEAQKFKLTSYTGEKVYTGIDVSYHNSIDWAKIATSDIGFVIIRAGYGGDWTHQDDQQFENNVAACEKYNIPYGLYLYSYASSIDGGQTSAQAEAKHMLRLINTIGADGYSPNLGTKVFIDMEDKSVVNAGKDKLTSVSDTFCSTIENNGYSCGIYANRTWLTNHLNTEELVKKYEIWLAEYLPVQNPTFAYAKTQKPKYDLTEFRYWQFASDGQINGINGNADFDLGYDIFDY